MCKFVTLIVITVHIHNLMHCLVAIITLNLQRKEVQATMWQPKCFMPTRRKMDFPELCTPNTAFWQVIDANDVFKSIASGIREPICL